MAQLGKQPLDTPTQGDLGEHAGPPSIELVHEDEVRHYFDAFARALTSGEGAAIASLWDLPALVMMDGGARAVKSADEIAKIFAGAKRMYAARGIVDTRPDIQYVEWLTQRIVVADVRWPLFDDLHKELGSESSTYTLMRDHSGALKLRVIVMRGEIDSDMH
jgi:hypothetical protein